MKLGRMLVAFSNRARAMGHSGNEKRLPLRAFSFASGLVLLLWQMSALQGGTIVTEISVGSGGGGGTAGYSLFIKSDGSLSGTGENHWGQLGSSIPNIERPEQIVASNVTAVTTGDIHTLFLKNEGSLWGMGYNGYGELGDGTFNNSYTAEEILSKGVVAVSCGNGYSLFLESDGSLWGMGLIGGQSTNRPEEIVPSNVVAIAAGDYHSLLLKSDGSLWGMGQDQYGQLGVSLVPYYTNQPIEVVASVVYRK